MITFTIGTFFCKSKFCDCEYGKFSENRHISDLINMSFWYCTIYSASSSREFGRDTIFNRLIVMGSAVLIKAGSLP